VNLLKRDVASPKKRTPVSWSKSADHVEICQESQKILSEYRGKSSTDHLVWVYDPERSGKLAMNDFYLMMKDLFINERELMISFPTNNQESPVSLFEVAFSYRSINRAIEKAMFEEVGLSRRLYESLCKNMYFTAELFWPILFLLNELSFIRAYRVDAPPRSPEEEAFYQSTAALLKRLTSEQTSVSPIAVSLRVPQRSQSRAFTSDEAKAELYSMDPSLIKLQVKAPIAQLFKKATSTLQTATGKPPAVDAAVARDTSRSDKSDKPSHEPRGKQQVEIALRDIFSHYTFPHEVMTLSQWNSFCKDFELSGLSETQLRAHFREAAHGSTLLSVEGFLEVFHTIAAKIEMPPAEELLAGRTYLKMGLFSGNVDS
jgi:hypothetical protein